MKISAYTIKRENVLNLYIMYGFYVRSTKIKTSWIKFFWFQGNPWENQPPLHLCFIYTLRVNLGEPSLPLYVCIFHMSILWKWIISQKSCINYYINVSNPGCLCLKIKSNKMYQQPSFPHPSHDIHILKHRLLSWNLNWEEWVK